ncbi:serine carboxypeptidase-like 7 isoform X5 [Senna tora]|uniref:Serine carboxypeptidase-like 7 isoform X5 n=1 Tax=Senna tora TaxID=362788 RepID=A0A834SYZ5_9FABA|nr:serine carboxypeptidase-like 7 isoform X5 [Senna tora]
MHMKMLLLSYENGVTDCSVRLGPFKFKMQEYNGSLPTLALNPHSWTKISSIIFVDLPANTGFSYAKPPIATQRSDSKQVQHAVQFIRKNFSQTLSTLGDSYAGLIVPAIALEIVKGYEVSSREADLNVCYPPALAMECFNKSYGELLITYWVNDDVVRRALGIRQGSIGQWKRCLKTPYAKDIESSFPFHVELSTKEYRALVYSGDHDFVVPFSATQAWIRSLNYSIVDEWRPWLVQTQIAGYTRMYLNGMTFATVKEDPKGEVHIVVVNSLVLVSVIELHHEGYGVVGRGFQGFVEGRNVKGTDVAFGLGAGHTAPEYKSKECFAMFERDFSEPL